MGLIIRLISADWRLVVQFVDEMNGHTHNQLEQVQKVVVGFLRVAEMNISWKSAESETARPLPSAAGERLTIGPSNSAVKQPCSIGD